MNKQYEIHIIHHVDWNSEQIVTHCNKLMGKDDQIKRENILKDGKRICTICLAKFNKEIESWKIQ